jgi:hypothetical protein
VIKKTWSTAEDTINYAASCVLPIVQTTFEKPIHAVDTLACITLNKVEETLPVVTKTPEEVSFFSLVTAKIIMYPIELNYV